jgi:hypothetical protein
MAVVLGTANIVHAMLMAAQFHADDNLYRKVVVVLECAVMVFLLAAAAAMSWALDRDRRHAWLSLVIFASRFSVFQFSAIYGLWETKEQAAAYFAVASVLMRGKLAQVAFADGTTVWTLMNLYSFMMFMFNIATCPSRHRVGMYTCLSEHACQFASILSNSNASVYSLVRVLLASSREEVVNTVTRHMPVPMYEAYTVQGRPVPRLIQ